MYFNKHGQGVVNHLFLKVNKPQGEEDKPAPSDPLEEPSLKRSN